MSQTRPPHDGGSSALGDQEPRKRRGLWWLWLLAAVVVIILLLLLLSRCGGDDSSSDAGSPSPSASDTAAAGGASIGTSSAGTSPSAVTSPPASASPSVSEPTSSAAGASAGSGTANGGAGILTAGGTSLLPLATAAPQGALSAYNGMPVVGHGVTVLSVPADEGFWVGTSTDDRVWVQLTGSGESPYQVKTGDRVDLTGTMVSHGQGFAAKVGVSGPEGAAQLTSQMSHVKVAQDAVTLSSSS